MIYLYPALCEWDKQQADLVNNNNFVISIPFSNSEHGETDVYKRQACNNQEENRRGVSSIVSERALREIYLKEMCIRDRLTYLLLV